MGAAVGLFFSSNTEKQTLHRRITPTTEQFDDQTKRWNELADFLRPALKEATEYTTSTWLQGSYKFGTQIRPVYRHEEFDIDVGFYFRWTGTPDDGNFGPKELKDTLQDSLHQYAEDNDSVIGVSDPKPRCARIRYKDSFHIDVPIYHLSDTNERNLATEDDVWEGSDPKAFYVWFKNSYSDSERAKVRRQIRYLKTWAALKFRNIKNRPTSILLTVLTAEAVNEIGAAALPDEDDDALHNVVTNIVARIDESQVVSNPANQEENLGKRLDDAQWKDIIQALNDLNDVTTRAVAARDETEAASMWQEAFEHMFPLPEETVTKAIAEDSRQLPALQFVPQIRVRAVSEDNPKFTYEDMNKIGPIPKNCSVDFELLNASQLPLGARVSWTVRNEGPDAEAENDLGHRHLDGLSASEHTAYQGRHFMDCTVTLHGRTIAVRRVPVTISAFKAPRRNPIKRPDWTRLR